MSSEMLDLFFSSFGETLIMVGISGILGALFGVPLGITLHLTGREGILPHPISNRMWQDLQRGTLDPFHYSAGSGNSVYPFLRRHFDRYCSRHRAADDRLGAIHCAAGGNCITRSGARSD